MAETTKPIPDSDVVSDVLADYHAAWTAKQAKEILFTDIYRRYRSYLDISQQVTRSSLFIPESFTVVETVAPRMTAKKPSFKVLPRSAANISQADKVGKLLDYQYDFISLHPKIKDFSKQALIYGTSFMKVGWDVEKQAPAVEPIDIADIWGDPSIPNWDKGYIVHRYYASLHDLESSGVSYSNLNALKEPQGEEAESQPLSLDNRLRQDRNAVQNIPTNYAVDGFEILEWWGYVDGNVWVKTVADRRVLLRNEKSPYDLNYLPFIPCYDQKIPFDKWGVGEIEPIIALQDEENTTRNQRIDEKNLSIHNMWLVSKLAGVDYKNIQSKPGGIILANDINGVKPVDKQNITQDSIQEINLIKDDIRNTTGVNDYVRGEQTANQTATEVASKTQEANVRFTEKVTNLELSLKKIGEWMVALNAQYMTKALEFRIEGKFGPENQKITLKDIRGEYDVDIETGSSLPANPDLRRQQLTELVQTIYPVLQNPAGIPDGMRELLRTLLQSFDLKNTDDILQGAQDPMVGQVTSQLSPDELQGANPQMVQEEIKRQLMAGGHLQQPQPQPGAQGAPQGQPGQGAQAQRPPGVSINFKDLPPDGQIQAAAEAGIQLHPDLLQAQQAMQQPAQPTAPVAGR